MPIRADFRGRLRTYIERRRQRLDDAKKIGVAIDGALRREFAEFLAGDDDFVSITVDHPGQEANVVTVTFSVLGKKLIFVVTESGIVVGGDYNPGRGPYFGGTVRGDDVILHTTAQAGIGDPLTMVVNNFLATTVFGGS